LLLVVPTCTGRPGQGLLAPAPGSPVAIETGAGNVALADIDGDARADFVIAGGSPSAITIRWGDGKGGLLSRPSATVALAQAPGELALADFDRDGKIDLAVASHDTYDVVVLLGDGRGGFTPANGSPFASSSGTAPHNHGLVAADVDEDGRLDLVAVQSNDNTLAVLLGDGRGGFSPRGSSPAAAGPSPYPPALGDVDGDGHLDVAVPNTGTGAYYREHQRLARTITLLLGDGTGAFHPAPASPLEVADGPYYVALADLDGDGALDLVATHDDSDLVSLLLNDGKGRFSPAPQSPIAIGRRAFEVALEDLDADRDRDLILATGDSVTLLLGDGTGRFAPAPGSPFAAGRGTWQLAIADLDRDGELDVVSSNLESRTISVLLGR
jgi:hypothetical protein